MNKIELSCCLKTPQVYLYDATNQFANPIETVNKHEKLWKCTYFWKQYDFVYLLS